MQSALRAHSGLSQQLDAFQDSLAGRATLTVAATGLMALAAHITVPLPFTPVPLTLQSFAVIIIGMTLGPVTALSAMILYLAEGAMGLPVFSPAGVGGMAQLLGPDAGYLLSYPIAAAAAGWAAKYLRALPTLSRGAVAGTLSTLIVLSLGTAWLATEMHLSTSAAWHIGIAPFVPGEAIKIAAAALLFRNLQRQQS